MTVAEFLKSYVRWREGCEAVRGAYERWVGVEERDRAVAFAAYHAALDQEERAARAYRQCVDGLACRAG
jgi:hypothetical protein